MIEHACLFVICPQQTGSSGAAGSELQFNTEKDIQNMGRDFASNKEAVETMLVNQVCTVNVKAPERRIA